MSFRFPLALSSWDDQEIKAIHSVIDSNQYSMGPRVSEYEQQFARFFGSKYAVMCSSGSTANLIMTAALFFRKNKPLRAGDTVVVPAVSWSTTFYPLAQYGLKLRFVDIDRETLNYDLKSLESALRDGPRLLMVVNLLGNPNQFDAINKMIGGRDIEIIEDNCESMGATFAGRQTGTFGRMGTFSSFFSHHISTMEGGCVVTDDEEYYHLLLCLRAHGWTRNLPKHNHVTGTKSDDFFEESFKFVLPGYNVRPLEMSGAIGSEQLKKLPGFVRVRRANAEAFQHAFRGHQELLIQREIGDSSWFGFSFVIRPESRWRRKDLVSYLQAEGVECRPIVTGNFAKNPVMNHFHHELHNDLPQAQLIDQQGFFVGNHHVPMETEIRTLSQIIEQFGRR